MLHENRAPPVFATPANATRTAINSALSAHTAKQLLPEGHYPIRICAQFPKTKVAHLSRSQRNHLMQQSDSKFGRLPPFIDLILGMDLFVTQNICVQKGISNGTRARLR